MLDIAEAKRLIDSAEIVSFDVFDTLIRRKVDSPLAIFHLMKAEVHDLTEGAISDFRSIRVQSEKNALEKARQNGVEEVTFDDIYRAIQELTGIDDSIISKLQELEIETELKCVDIRFVGYDLFQYAKMLKKKIVLASDMYLPRNAILSLLERAGVGGFSVFYLSNELMKTKREGDLFVHILMDLQIEPSQIVHIGDNPKGDIASPRALSIAAFHLPRSMVSFRQSSEFAKTLDLAGRKSWSLTKSVIDAMIADRFFDDCGKSDMDSFFASDPFQFGYTALGPMMLGFSFWLYREAKADGVSRLYFLSRDGEIMKRVFDELFPFEDFGIETDYLYCSRRMTRVPMMKNRFDLLQPIAKAIHARTLGNWLESNYGIEADKIDKELFERHGFVGADESINNKVDREALTALVLEIENILLDIASDERGSLLRYLSQKGLGTGKHAVVDIGYAGTMQDSLSSLLGQKLKGYYLAVFGTAAGVKDQLDLKGFVSQYGADDNPSLGICTHRFVYESLICNSEDTVLRVAVHGDGFVPVGKSHGVDEQRKYFVDYAHSGAVALAKEYKNSSPIRPEVSILSSEVSTLTFDTYLRYPMAKDVELLYGIAFEDLYGVVKERYLAAEPGIRKHLEPSQIIWKESLKVKQPVSKPTAKGAESTAKSALAKKNFSGAAESFLQAFELLPSRPNYLRAAAEAYFAAGNRKMALEKLSEYQRLNPKNTRVKARKWVMRFPVLAKIIGGQEFSLQ
ncbi:HAD family hydrolase [Agrobacterium sp. NPDC089420]|uniref:HAD family hydrolase n=1 Tax=Agrobacterium sp. NPDC089420 TaxID=3363918 RepID=UPI00384FCDF3